MARRRGRTRRRHRSAACASRRPRASQAAPCGARGRPRRYSNVVSSGAIMPARAPASIDMLQTVMRSSIDSASIAGPRYSITWPVPPSTPILPMIARIRSLAVTPGAQRARSTSIASVFGLRCSRHCVASTCPTSVVPMPKASAPNAPCVLVWLSPQTMVMPGCVSAELRADDVHDAAPVVLQPEQLDAELARSCASSCRTCRAADSTAIGTPPNDLRRCRSASSDPSSRACGPGGARCRPRARSTSKACGEVTSCTRCRSMYSTAGVSAVSGTTTCRSQTFSNSVRGRVFTRARSSDRDRLGGRDPLLAPGTGDGVARCLDPVDDLEESSHGRLDDVGGDAGAAVERPRYST